MYRVIPFSVQVARQLALKAVQLIGPAEVLLAGEGDVIAPRAQAVRPGHFVGAQRRDVVPGADVVDEAAGHE